MTPAELEAVYEQVAEAIDALPAEQERLFLARLALALANACEDPQRVREAIAAASAIPESRRHEHSSG